MEDDLPSTIAILGAGPIGLEAALYARYLGYNVRIFEQGRVAENISQWGHVRLFSLFGSNRSSLALAALAAQDDQYLPPDDEALLTGHEFIQQYLLPLSRTDLLVDSLVENMTVVAVGRQGLLKTEKVGDPRRAEVPFSLLLREASGSERIELADIVIDATGLFGNPHSMGQGGIPAPGETACFERIEHGLPDILGTDREHYEGRHSLVVGAGYSAATTVVALARLAKESPTTRVTWVYRKTDPAAPPISPIENDRLPERARLTEMANSLAQEDSQQIVLMPATEVGAIHWEEDDQQFAVALVGQGAEMVRCDRVVAHVGFRPDLSLYRELPIHQCYASEGPMGLAAANLGQAHADCLDQTSAGPESLRTSEPNFYILGSKSYGRNSQFLMSLGLEQIREVFTLIGERADLNLYESDDNAEPRNTDSGKQQ